MAQQEEEQKKPSFGDNMRSFGRRVSLGAKEFNEDRKRRFALEGECAAANEVLLEMINPEIALHKTTETKIPLKILQNAQGLAFYTEVKAGFLFTGKGGTGIVISRLPEGGWSGPSCFGAGGVGAGFQVGISKTNTLIVLNNKSAVDVFAGKGQFKFGADLEVTAGPVGRDVGGAIRGGDGGVAPCYSYSHSKGLYAGVSIDGTILITNKAENTRFYGEQVDPKDILSGVVSPPESPALDALLSTLATLDAGQSASDRAAEAVNDATSGIKKAVFKASVKNAMR